MKASPRDHAALAQRILSGQNPDGTGSIRFRREARSMRSAFAPMHQAAVAVGEYGAVPRSDDRGATWNSSKAGLRRGPIRRILSRSAQWVGRGVQRDGPAFGRTEAGLGAAGRGKHDPLVMGASRWSSASTGWIVGTNGVIRKTVERRRNLGGADEQYDCHARSGRLSSDALMARL